MSASTLCVLLKFVLCISVFVTLASAAPDGDECVIQGNPDILGIGVRLGIYFQLVANLAIAFIHPDEALGSLAVSDMLMTGIFISVLHSIVNQSISSAELICALWMVVLDFPLIFPIIAIASVPEANAKKANAQEEEGLTIWTVYPILIRWIAFAGLNVWFWFCGLQNHHQSQCPDPRTFFFANLSAKGKILTFYKVTGILGIFIACLMLMHSLGSTYYRFLKPSTQSYKEKWGLTPGMNFWFRSSRPSVDVSTGERRVEAMWLKGKLRQIQSSEHKIQDLFLLEWEAFALLSVSVYSWGLYGFILTSISLSSLISWIGRQIWWARMVSFTASCLIVALCAMPVELQIYWNNIEGVDGMSSAGQLISFTVGAFSVIRAIFLALMDKSSGGVEGPGSEQGTDVNLHISHKV